jgi:AcrR family transcriptional regulator
MFMEKTIHKDLGRRQRRKQETRQQIFQAAMNLFARKGIFSTTVEEITDAADVGKGTFFNYFPSKEAILSALAERQLEIIDRAVEKAGSAVTVRPVLKEMVRELVSGPARSPIMLRSLFATVLSNQMLLGLFSRSLQAGREKVATIIERGQQIGEIRRDVPAIEIARCLQQTAFGTSFIWAASQPSDLMAWQERSMDLFWRGISTHSESGSGPLNSKRNGGAS